MQSIEHSSLSKALVYNTRQIAESGFIVRAVRFRTVLWKYIWLPVGHDTHRIDTWRCLAIRVKQHKKHMCRHLLDD